MEAVQVSGEFGTVAANLSAGSCADGQPPPGPRRGMLRGAGPGIRPEGPPGTTLAVCPRLCRFQRTGPSGGHGIRATALPGLRALNALNPWADQGPLGRDPPGPEFPRHTRSRHLAQRDRLPIFRVFENLRSVSTQLPIRSRERSVIDFLADRREFCAIQGAIDGDRKIFPSRQHKWSHACPPLEKSPERPPERPLSASRSSLRALE